jgi:hypothetical protein
MLCSKRRWLRQQPSWRRLVLCLKRSTMLGSQSCGCKLSEGDWPYHVGEVEQDVEYVSRCNCLPLLMSASQ